VVEPTGVDSCPQCGMTSGVQRSTEISPRVRVWGGAGCGTRWAATVIRSQLYLDHLAAVVELAAARSVLRDVITLADQAPRLTDEQLKFRLVMLAKITAQGVW
jgi:hypothetical protein